MAVQVQELGELVALSQIGEKGRGREEVLAIMRGRDAHGRGRAVATDDIKADIKADAVHSE